MPPRNPAGLAGGKQASLSDLYNLHQNTSARHFYSRENAEIAVNGRKKRKKPLTNAENLL